MECIAEGTFYSHNLTNPEIEKHHELCLGVLAQCYKYVPAELQQAIYEGIEYAAELGFAVDARKLPSGKGIFSGGTS